MSEDSKIPPRRGGNTRGEGNSEGRDSFVPAFAEHAALRNLYYDGNRLPYNPDLTQYSRELRSNATPEERNLWKYLRTLPVKVYRQRPIDHYIVDFYFPHQDLVVEIDGGQHYSEMGKQHDAERTAVLESLGLKVMRFSNLDVRTNREGVCLAIWTELRKILPDIQPGSKRRHRGRNKQ